jgi:hypothetical protein
MDQVYKRVEDFTDLLQTNLMFFRGEIPRTYYYLAPWGKGADQNNHAEVATTNLIELTEQFRVFTIGGQSSYHTETVHQRSFLECVMEANTFQRVVRRLMGDERIWVYFSFPNYSVMTSLAKRVNNLALTIDRGEEFTHFWVEPRCRDECGRGTGYKNVDEVFTELILCWIVCKEFDTDPTADTILLEALKMS